MGTSRGRVWGPLFLRAAEAWMEAVGSTDGPRLRRLVELVRERDELALSEALAACFPELATDEATAVKRFKAFRSRVNGLAEEIRPEGEVPFALDADAGRGAAARRRCWFTGPDLAQQGAIDLAEASTADIGSGPAESSLAVPTLGGRREVRYFLCYLRSEKRPTFDLIERFEKCAGGTRFSLKRWDDRKIAPGELWHETIQRAIRECDVALVMLSSALLGNDYVKEHEIPNFALDTERPGKKPVIPVGLATIDLDLCVVEWVKKRQFFKLEDSMGRPLFFADCTTEKRKDEFARSLFRKLHEKLDAMWPDAPAYPKGASPKPGGDAAGSLTKSRRLVEPVCDVGVADEFARELPEGMSERDAIKHFERTRGWTPKLGEMQTVQQADPGRAVERGVDALDYLHAWLDDPKASQFLAVLGEYGIGKTTTLKRFTRDLLERRRSQSATPLPIYVDLRLPQWRPDAMPQTVRDLLGDVIRRNWRLGGEPTVTPDELLRLVREERAVIIFDGLDEKIVHLPPGDAQAFIRLLWQVLPLEAFAKQGRESTSGTRRGSGAAKPSTAEAPREEPLVKYGRLIISCRSQYFRDLTSQNSLLTGEDREGLPRGDTPALCLLPFSEEQIRSYLRAIHDGDEVRATAAYELLYSIHNLRELAERPYLLSVITERLGELEALRARGEVVNSARLYQLFTERWLSRDDGKHTLEPAHKREIMERLAHAFWCEGAREWDVDRLEAWFDELLFAVPRIASVYAGQSRAVLKEDLRTATFVLRPDTEERHFRFAHTSLLEFFLAARLWRSLSDGTAAETWDIPEPSAETFVFLVELLALERRPEVALLALAGLLEAGKLPAGRHAFRVWLLARERGAPEPAPTRVVLPKVNLEGWRIAGRSGAGLFPLRGADLRGAQLGRTRWELVDLNGADLSDAQAPGAEFLSVAAHRLNLERALLSGTMWRDSVADGLITGRADGRGAIFIRTVVAETALPTGAQRFPIQSAGRELHYPDWELGDSRSHLGGVNGCTWSPDGTRVASVSDDATLKIWDVATGSCLGTLSGHTDLVNGCAWESGGSRIASASDDCTLKVWDAHTGVNLTTFLGHNAAVRACAWVPDGRRLVSASEDGVLKIWDTESSACVLTLSGHLRGVWACTWDPSGCHILSASGDRTLRIWNAENGDCIATLSGHLGVVRGCAWAPDGLHVASASDDGTLKVWSVASATCVLTLSGHARSVSGCTWAPKGSRLLSASEDQTLKIWDTVEGICSVTLSGHQHFVNGCAWEPCTDRVVSASADCSLKVWDGRSGACLTTFARQVSPVRGCAWAPDGERMVSTSGDAALRIWDAENGSCLVALHGHRGSIRDCSWSPNGVSILSAAYDETLKIWDAISGACVATLVGHLWAIPACAWAPDSMLALSAAWDATLKIWNVTTGDCLATLSGHELPVRGCAWAPDGGRVLSVSDDKKLKIWDAATGSCIRTLSGHRASVTGCAWAPDGSRVLSGSDDATLKIWDAATGTCVVTLCGHLLPVNRCAWAPDSARVLSASDDRTLKIWDAIGGACLVTLVGHRDRVRGCGWEVDGVRVISSSYDGTVRVWDAGTGECLAIHWHFDDGSTATTIPGGGIKWAGPGAWRHLRWYRKDQVVQDRVLPAEAFGPLP